MNEIVTHFVVPADHPSLAGHFPGRPIVPGVVLLDLVYEALAAALPVELVSIVSTKFQQAVAPGMRVDLTVKLMPDEQPGRMKARFTAMHARAPVLEGSFMLSAKDHAE
jgi:3-hydroxymyristoyl/3-hydroxydecanoyl-(acyl carrier protein) dehydratase